MHNGEFGLSFGVRPVIEIPKSVIDEVAIVSKTYNIGETVRIGNEHFYVIKDATDKVTLLSKYNLNADGLQDTTGETNPCAFSAASNYAGVDLNNNATLRADTTSALYKAIQYGARFEIDGVEGRLMTLGEVKELGGNDYSTEGCNTNGYGFVSSVDGKSLNYWLATDFNGGGYLYSVHGSSLAGDWYDGEDYGAYSGVRPVIEIPKSLIDIEKVTIALRKLAYTIGEEVTIGKEHFYVIADNQEQLTLLAKYNLKADGTQDTTGAVNACVYIATADTISAPDKAEEYGEKFEETYKVDGVIGRLPTLADIHALGGTGDDSNSGSTAACNTNGNSFVNSTDKGVCKYWLDTVSTVNSAYQLVISGSGNWNIMNDQADGYFGLSYGVRPVLVVSKSAI